MILTVGHISLLKLPIYPPSLLFMDLSNFSTQFYFILPKFSNICWFLIVLNVFTGIVGVMQSLKRIWYALCSLRPFVSWKAKLPIVALHCRCIYQIGLHAPMSTYIIAIVTSCVYLYWFPSVARRGFFMKGERYTYVQIAWFSKVASNSWYIVARILESLE